MERRNRGKSVFVENAVKDDGWTRMEWQRDGMGGKVRKHALLQLGKALLLEWVLFLKRLISVADKAKKTSPTSLETTCGDNSIVHFIRSVALRYKHAYFFVPGEEEGRSGCGVTVRGEMYRCTGGLRKVERGILTPRIMARPRGVPN